MSRHVAAVAVVLCLAPSWLCAQTVELTVSTASANVHKGPSTGSPVIGTAPRGTVLEVTRELGDWVKVSWPSVPDSTGYVHRSTGSLAPRSTSPASGRPGAARPRPAPAAALSTAPLAQVEHNGGVEPSRSAAVYVTPRTHVVGVGGRMSGSTIGYGATARGWSRERLGVQLHLSRSALTSTQTAGRVTSLEFAPSVLYSLPDRVTDYVWLRPYVGAGPSLNRASQSGFGSTNKIGFNAFGGAEVTFASLPRFAVSADLVYRSSQTPFEGFKIGGLGFAVSGHWYVK